MFAVRRSAHRMPDYVELHAASAFSFLRGGSQPEHVAEEAARLGLPAVALLDRDGVYGTPRFYNATRECGVRPLVGAEVTLEDGSVLPLLVTSRAGYQNLCRLISTAKLTPRSSIAPIFPSAVGVGPDERKRPCFATWSEIAAHADGLIALTGDEDGPVRCAWQNGGAAKVAPVIEKLRGIFGRERLYVELQRHRVHGEEVELRALRDLASAYDLPLLATGGVLHAVREDRPVTDVFTCLRHHTTLDQAGKLLLPNGERHLRAAAVMCELFRDLPEAIANTRRVADQMDFTLRDLGYRFPDFPVGPGEKMEEVLRELTYAGARTRIGPITDKLDAQLTKELTLINKLGFAGYFLIVWDICRWCRERGILIQGRGSAANSAVCYALHITAVNPLQHRLLFERFLSEGRVGADGHPSWPDIDLDLPSGDLRESVIQQIYERYQPRGAAMVANVITYRGRGAAREVGKVLDLPADVLDRFSSLYANGDFPQTLDLQEQVKMSGLPATHPRLPAMIALCQRLHGLPRHLGQHSGGMVLCPGRLDQVVPIENATMEKRTVVQWDKDDCEDLGLVKIDFLGLGMMAVLQDSFALCQARGGPHDLDGIPKDDARAFEVMQKAETIGVFQIESRAQMATLPRFRPSNLYEVAIQVSIVRPGPITGNLVHPLIRRRNQQEEVVYLDDSIADEVRPILDRTYGVILFQEQMLEVAMVLANFTGAEAEELRRALGFHRNSDRLNRVTAKLRAALEAKKRYKPEVIAKVIESVTSFAAYGFPESHAISFALLAYASTWLKVHRPAEFLVGLLNNQPMGFYSPATLVQDARRRGTKIRPVCIQNSDWKCTVEPDGSVRIGLSYVHGLREEHVTAMTAARAEGKFTSLADFISRTRFNPTERRALAASGALNALAGHRRAALWQIEAAWSAEETLFHRVGLMSEDDDAMPLAPMNLSERLQADFALLDLTAGAHPMQLVRDRLPDVWRASDLALARDGETVVVAGSVICRQRPGTAKGFVFISLEDETGIANAVVRPDLFERRRMVINEEPALRITGRLQHQSGVIHIKAETIEALRLAEIPEQASHDFR